MNQLVLSCFPGIGLLDMAFEEEGFCVVRGPDLLWGGDIRRFHPPAAKFDGVIGGPPCQAFSPLVHLNRALYGEHVVKPNLIPEFERVIAEAAPDWFLMENVPDAPVPAVKRYAVSPRLVRDVAVGGETSRLRRFTFGSRPCWMNHRPTGFQIEELALYPIEVERTVVATAGGRRVNPAKNKTGGALPHETTRPIDVMCKLQGLPEDFFGPSSPFHLAGKRIMIGNGVPLPMGRAVAKAVKRALGIQDAA